MSTPSELEVMSLATTHNRAIELSPVVTQPDDDTVGELITYYRALSGEHEDWYAYRAAMVTERRVVVRLTPDRAYGVLSLP